MKRIVFGAAAMVLAASPAHADIRIEGGNIPQIDENILLQTGGTLDNLVYGNTNQTASLVTFTGSEAIVSPSSGQARIEAADGGLNFLNISLAPGFGFTSLILNLDATSAGSVLFTVDEFGNALHTAGNFALVGSGSNFFTITAINNQIMTGVSFLSDVDLSDVAQFRLGGVTALTAVPEPATWGMMLLGFGIVGAAMRKPRQRKTARINFA